MLPLLAADGKFDATEGAVGFVDGGVGQTVVVNNCIPLLVQKACGYRNRKRLKTGILFHFDGLDLTIFPLNEPPTNPEGSKPVFYSCEDEYIRRT